MKKNKVLFLSHNPHCVHLKWAKSLNARIKIIKLNKYVLATKKFKFLGYFYPLVSLIYSFFIKVKEDILLVEGGSSLYVACFLKMRNHKLKIIYLDVDILFYNWHKRKILTRNIHSFLFFKPIDAVISVSSYLKQFSSKYLKVPIEISNPFPKHHNKFKIKRENYGLYVGRLDPDKNIKRILNFSLSSPYIEKFIVIGDGTFKKYIKKLSRKNKKLIYLGTKKDVGKYYSQCKFLIHLPDSDPHPCTTMEAALFGCFPIISKGSGTSYLFDDIFIINNPEDFKEINKKIKHILDNENKTRTLLKKTNQQIPTKKQSLKNFRKSFNILMKQIR